MVPILDSESKFTTIFFIFIHDIAGGLSGTTTWVLGALISIPHGHVTPCLCNFKYIDIYISILPIYNSLKN